MSPMIGDRRPALRNPKAMTSVTRSRFRCARFIARIARLETKVIESIAWPTRSERSAARAISVTFARDMGSRVPSAATATMMFMPVRIPP